MMSKEFNYNGIYTKYNVEKAEEWYPLSPSEMANAIEDNYKNPCGKFKAFHKLNLSLCVALFNNKEKRTENIVDIVGSWMHQEFHKLGYTEIEQYIKTFINLVDVPCSLMKEAIRPYVETEDIGYTHTLIEAIYMGLGKDYTK